MNKKIILSLGTIASASIPAAAAISCGTETTVNGTNVQLSRLQVLKGSSFGSENGYDNTTVGIHKYGKDLIQDVNVVDSIDNIIAPDIIAVWDNTVSVFDKTIFLNNFEEVKVNGSNLVQFSFKNNDGSWAISSDGVIAKYAPGTSNELTITVGTTTKKVTLMQREHIVNKKAPNIDHIPTSPTVAFPSVWGTTTTVTYGTFNGISDNPLLKVNMVDTVEGKGGAKAYGYISGMKTMTDKISFDTSANYIALRVYVPENMVGSKYWFRAYFDEGQNIDFNSASQLFDKSGWYTFVKKIDHLKFTSSEASLDKIKIVQMVTDTNALSGDIYIDGIYTSDEDIKI